MQQSRIIKSFKQLSLIDRRELYSGDKLKTLDKRFAVSFARQLANGFDNINLQKEPTKNQYQKARKVIDTWYNATRSGKSRIIRPRTNKKAYAEFSDMPENFKVFLVPVLEKNDKFKIRRGKVVRAGKNIITEDYLFPDRKKAMKDIEGETKKLTKRIERDYKAKIKQVFIKVGRHETKARYQPDTVYREIEKWTQIYGVEKCTEFVMGLRIFSFRGQEVARPSRLKKRKARN